MLSVGIVLKLTGINTAKVNAFLASIQGSYTDLFQLEQPLRVHLRINLV